LALQRLLNRFDELKTEKLTADMSMEIERKFLVMGDYKPFVTKKTKINSPELPALILPIHYARALHPKKWHCPGP